MIINYNKEELNDKAGVYKITCLSNGRFYIGSSKNLYQRYIEHRSKLRKNKHHNKELQSDYNTYNINNFKFEVIEYCYEDIRKDREQMYLTLYKDDDRMYNKSTNAYANNYVDDKTKQKLSEAMKGEKNHFYGKHHTDEAKRKMSEFHKGKFLNEETKRKIGEASKGHIVTKETRSKISRNNPKSKIIYIYDLEGNLISNFSSIRECTRYLLDNKIIISKAKNPVDSISKTIKVSIKENKPYDKFIFSHKELTQNEINNIYKNKTNHHKNGVYMYKDSKEYYFETVKDCCKWLIDNDIVISNSKKPLTTISALIIRSIKNNKLYKGFYFSYEPIEYKKVS